jgi:hypothetical protein
MTTTRRVVAGVIAAVAMGIAAGPALAQPAPEPVRPPKAELPGPQQAWLAALVALALGALAVGVAVLPSQRTHQD